MSLLGIAPDMEQVLKTKRIISILLSTLICATASGEQLELRSGTLLSPTLTPSGNREKLLELASRPNASHLVVRLHRNLDPDGRRQLKRSGLELLSCLGPRTWIAAIPGADALDLPNLVEHVAWSGPLKKEWKLHPFLAEGRIPHWTVAEDQIHAARNGDPIDPLRLIEQLGNVGDPPIVVYLLAHPDVALDDFEAMIPLVARTEILSRMKSVNGLVVRMPFSEIDRLVAMDEVTWLEPALPQLSELNDSNREVTQVNQVHESPYRLDGSGVTVLVYDSGIADPSHPDFAGRLTIHDDSEQSSHSTHVAGTLGGNGAGSGGSYRGMAPNVTMLSYGFQQDGDLSEGFLYTDPGDIEHDYSEAIFNHGAVLANNSIGTNTAPNGFPCEWTGDYGVTSSLIDSVVRGSLGAEISIIWANGNERQTDRCGNEYSTTAPPACAKNIITVGALNSNDESMTDFSSWGPTDDGRIKPDLSAPGCQSNDDNGVNSCAPGGGYSVKCGTSMSSPTACGISALIIQEWRNLHPGIPDPRNSTLKALLANSGADLGHPGPDCLYGFGSVRARNAIDQLRAGSVIEGDVSDGETHEFLIVVDEHDSELKITLAWDDEPATPLPLSTLVNDLDLLVFSPTDERHYPWTIDPASPASPAVQTREDHVNNAEQVTVTNPDPGVWRIQIRGFDIPVGPQPFSVSTTPEPTQCSSSGTIALNQGRYAPDSSLMVTVADCDLNLDDTIIDTVEVLVSSDDEPAGETLLLTEDDPASSVFSGGLAISSVDAPGTLLALDGSEVRATYIDEEDGNGASDVVMEAQAIMDGVPPIPTQVEIGEFFPDGVLIRLQTDEPTRVTIRHGRTCESLYEETSQNILSSTHEIRLSGLEDDQSHAFIIEIEDEAGNRIVSDNEGDCWTFTIPDFLDLHAEQFNAGIDLAGYMTRFQPIETPDAYLPCTTPITELPVNPESGNTLELNDDSFVLVSLPESIVFHGVTYTELYVNSNGSVTFGAGSNLYVESITEHFDRIGVSALFDDLDPGYSGTVSWTFKDGDLAITFEDVAEFDSAGASLNTFQIVFAADGSVIIAWLDIGSTDAVIGISAGNGFDQDFIPTDFSEASRGCIPRPPRADDIDLSVLPGDLLDIRLTGNDDGQPGPPGELAFTVLTLPQWPLRDPSTGEQLTSDDLPYTLSSSADPILRYGAPSYWEGQDHFTFLVDDGGEAPTGGASQPGTVEIIVADGPQVAIAFPLDTDPGWFRNGDWAHGQPTGGGGEYGFPDPTSGHTGSNVFGYNLQGDYEGDIPEYVLVSDPIDCSSFSGTTLRFQRWLNVESPSYDHARVELDAGDGWTTIWENTSAITDLEWVQVEYDISRHADGVENLRIRWVMGATDETWNFSGWNIDDIEFIAVVSNPGIPGDLNGDGVVNGQDIGLLLVNWGTCQGCPADFNGDGEVNGEDFGLMLVYWSGDDGFAPAHAGPIIDMSDRPRITTAQPEVADQRLVNAERLAPREHGGVVIAENGYLQLPGATLDIELVGGLPIVGHDLLLVEGAAEIDGRLELQLPDESTPEDGLYVVLLADHLTGTFNEVVVRSGSNRVISTCSSEHAIIVRIGKPHHEHGPDDFTPALGDVVALIDSMDGQNLDWDLDDNGTVDASDLAILLGTPTCHVLTD